MAVVMSEPASAGFLLDQLALFRSRVEVKSDREAATTGHVFIEFRQGSTEKGKGAKSGIAVTTAEWWAIEIVGVAWVIIDTERLQALARLAIRQRGSVMGGDGKRFEGALVPVDWLVRPWRSA